MEFETFVMEPVRVPAMDFGQSHQAYDAFPQARESYHAEKEAYLRAIDSLKGRDLMGISAAEMEQVDVLGTRVEQARERCLRLRAVLSEKVSELLAEGVKLGNELTYHTNRLEGDSLRNLERGLLALEECREWKDGEDGDILSVLENAYRIRTCLAKLLEEINSHWLRDHCERAENLRDEVK